ncbi:hypothetical protein GLAREA_06786 [Glarea lozoyensis ATCC 20868]|uniref:Uncharacterized protein n=1 Tax=Glarea lozoyensis (strain ATCC 20868 / MF5171) TaxID=1116229 RepID=S3E5Z5_GLAL2|nr:uncharacterized protein GLAREA_06786 [Glarea lozoyensis ATCC 20868]EPE33773.1 hypothetical protein GLAREA_06786 [Glarea lozoyensis ATCC 20868]
MTSKTATLFLLLHTLLTLLTTHLLTTFTSSTTKYDTLPPSLLKIFSLSIHLRNSVPLFLFLRLFQYCLQKPSRVTFKRHVLSAVVIAPLLAGLVGQWMGMGSGGVERAMACYEQAADLGDRAVIGKGVYCGWRFGVSRGQAERGVGVGRERGTYAVEMARVCYEGLRDVGEFVGGIEGVCYMGPPSSRTDEFNLEESRNSEHEYLRRAFEECYARFGLEVMMEWRDGMPVTRLKLPDKNGLKDGGKWVDIRGDGDERLMM